MSKKPKKFNKILVHEEIKQSISFKHKSKVNNNCQINQIKIPLYNNPLYIKTEINPIEKDKYLIQKENNIFELAHNKNHKNNLQNSKKNIYIKKKIHISPKRYNSQRTLNNNFFLSRFSNTYKSFSNSRNTLRKNNYNRIKEYINKNNNHSTQGRSPPFNDSIKKVYENSRNIHLTERNSLQRKNICIYPYLSNNDFNRYKYLTTDFENNQSKIRKIIENEEKNSSKIQKRSTKGFYESYIIKIQSVIRGYLLNKRLDKILRNYINIKEAIETIKKFYKRKILIIIKQFKLKKRYLYQNRYYNIKSNYLQNELNDNKAKENMNLEYKINELINEKNELQTNYNNLKEFMNKYNQLINEKAEMLQEIDNLRKSIKKIQTNNITYNYNKNITRYQIQKQNNLNIINHKGNNLEIIDNSHNNIESKKCQSINTFLTLGKETKDKNEYRQDNKNELLKISKMKYLFKIKENKVKIILCKYFHKFYYLSLVRKVNKIENQKYKINVINRRYNIFNNYENQNNIEPHISIKTLSDNSSVFNDGKGRNLSIITGYNIIEEDNKRK